MENFKILEERKIEIYNTMEQYAGTGFMIMFKPAHLCVLFKNFDFIHDIKAAVDSSEILIVYNERKGNRSFIINENFGDFAHIILIFSTFFAMYLGFNTFREKFDVRFLNCKWFFRTALSRVLVIGFIFFGLFYISYLIIKYYKVPLTGSESRDLFLYLLYALFFLILFFFTGVLHASIIKNRKKASIMLPVVWFCLIYLIPGVLNVKLAKDVSGLPSSEDLDIQKFTKLLNAQKEGLSYIKDVMKKNKNITKDELVKIFRKMAYDFLSKEYLENKRKEEEFHARVKDVINRLEKRSVFYPVDYFKFLSYEVSGNGYSQYAGFVDYVYDIRDRFYKFYVKKRYDSPVRKVENFIKNDENIYRAKSNIPAGYRKGIGITALYSLILLLTAFLIQKIKAVKIKKDIHQIDIEMLVPGKSHFRLCQEKKERRQICNYLHNNGAVIIEKIDLSECDVDLSLQKWLEYECYKREVDREEVIKELEGIEIAAFELKQKIKNLNPETLNLTYLTILLYQKAELYALNNFLSGFSRGCERKFRKVIKRIKGITMCLYLGEDIYEISEPETPNGAKTRFVVVEFDKISLR
jgi:hypothetical protein